MIGIIDYGVGNIYSLASSLEKIGQKVVISKEREVLANVDKLILPGVGAFQDARNKLRDSGLDKFLIEEASKGKHILGICLGMQLLFEKSYEYGEHTGLGILKGSVIPIKGRIPNSFKIPHMGWNRLSIMKKNQIQLINNEITRDESKEIDSNKINEENSEINQFINGEIDMKDIVKSSASSTPEAFIKYIKDGDYVYFVHSFYVTDCNESLIATCDYGISITAMVGKDNIMGCQFHPEKSGDVGLNILRGFCEEVVSA